VDRYGIPVNVNVERLELASDFYYLSERIWPIIHMAFTPDSTIKPE